MQILYAGGPYARSPLFSLPYWRIAGRKYSPFGVLPLAVAYPPTYLLSQS